MDDDIQFLGMVNTASPQRPYVHPSHPPLRPPASGIMLVIPKTGDEPTQTLRFLKSRSTVVHIGRASSSLGDAEKSPDTIQFRCPVISRRHAKLMFSSGHVYIVDLHSHHGTHLLRRDEIVSRPILPDVPIVLQDGDTLTFGKAVGKEPYSVSPITANVMLIYDTEAAPASPVSPPIISLVDSPPSPTTPIKGKQPLAAPKSSSSGRYGLFGPHSPASQSQSSPAASSEEDFSQSDHDGEEDEEEDEDDYYPDPSEDYPFSGHGQAHNSNNSVCYAPLPSLQGLGLLASRHVMHHAPPAHMYAHAAHTHMNMHVQPLSPSLELWFDSPQRLPAPNPTTNNNNTSHEIGAEEPMDISSPPSPTVANLLHDVPEGVIEEALRTEAHVPAETPIIGAYPGSPIRSAVVSPWCSDDVEEELQCDLVHDEVIMEQRSCNPESLPPPRFISAAVGTPGPASSIIAQASECATEHHFAEDDDDAASDIDADGDADVDVDPTPVSTTSAPASVPLDVPLLTSVAVAGPSTTTTTNNNNTGTGAAPAPGAITGSGMAIDARVTSLDEALVNLWGNVLRMQIAHRKTQTDHKALSDRTEALAARLDAAQSDLRSAIGAHEDAEVLRTRVVAAEALMAELQARLVSAEARMAEAEQAAAVVEQPQQQQTEVPTTRKRKREDEEDAGEVAEAVGGDEVKPREKCRNRKRARRFAWAAVHTAAAAAVGAVAAWSALAFA